MRGSWQTRDSPPLKSSWLPVCFALYRSSLTILAVVLIMHPFGGDQLILWLSCNSLVQLHCLEAPKICEQVLKYYALKWLPVLFMSMKKSMKGPSGRIVTKTLSMSSKRFSSQTLLDITQDPVINVESGISFFEAFVLVSRSIMRRVLVRSEILIP